jgi:hypothetical protein
MSLSVITQPAAGQRALWQLLRPRVAMDAFSCEWMLESVLPDRVPDGQGEMVRVILGFLSLFSACKSIRVHLPALITRVKRWFVPAGMPFPYEFGWERMTGLSVGEHMLLLRNYLQVWPHHHLRFRRGAVTAVSMYPPLELNRPIYRLLPETMRLDPTHPVCTAFGRMLLRYQATGDLREIQKLGFLSSAMNRTVFRRAVEHVASDPLLIAYVSCLHRLNLLGYICLHSFEVVDLSAPLVSDGELFGYLPHLTGLHVGIHSRDIPAYNVFSFRLGQPGIGFNDRIEYV